MNRPHTRKLLPAAAGLFLLAACGTQNALSRSEDYAALADYDRAFRVLDEEVRRQRRDGEVDPELAEAHERMRRSFLFDRAQRRLFQEREDEAEVDLDNLAQVAPDWPGIDSLRRRIQHKQAMRLVASADEHLAAREYELATADYLRAMKLVPDLELAVKGMKAVTDEVSRRDARAQQQFLQAVRKLPEFRYWEVQYHAAVTLENQPDRAEAEGLREAANRANARAAVVEAEQCKNGNQFGAAILLYRQALQLDPTLTDVAASIEAMEKEMAAVAVLEKAAILMRVDDFATARGLLESAYEEAVLTRPGISELLIDCRRLEGEKEYREARDLEVMGQKIEAREAFQRLAEAWPEGLLDEQARIAALTVDIDGAAEEWQAAEAAEAAGDLVKALDHMESARRYYEKWRDVDARIEALRKRIAEQQKSGGNGS